MDKGYNDLEATIERLEFRNAKLHEHNEKIELEIMVNLIKLFWLLTKNIKLILKNLESKVLKLLLVERPEQSRPTKV